MSLHSCKSKPNLEWIISSKPTEDRMILFNTRLALFIPFSIVLIFLCDLIRYWSKQTKKNVLCTQWPLTVAYIQGVFAVSGVNDMARTVP